MSGAIRVLLPPTSAHLAPLVQAAGGVPVVDATGDTVPEVPAGAWVRTRPGRPAPGTGPVVLAELGAPVPDRETWLETSLPRDVPAGFAGLVLKGREAGGPCGEEDGLVALARCSDPSRVVLDAGCGPATAAAAAALGAAGVLLVEQHLGCPEIALAPGLERRLQLPDDEVTRVVQGLRVCASATAPVLRRFVQGLDDPWSLAASVWQSGDPATGLWLMGQGLALARPLAERHGTLGALVAAYVAAWRDWPERARRATVGSGRVVSTAAALTVEGTSAGVGGAVGSAVLWEEASWLGRPVADGPILARMALGGPVVATAEELEAARASLPAPAALVLAPAPAEVVVRAAPLPEASVTELPPEASPAIAIVGIGCRFPGGASSPEAFWRNILEGKDAIGVVPGDRWDPDLFWDADAATPDKTYAKIGGFITDFKFDPKPFRIPPNVAKQVDTVQQLTLVCVADALKDAGLKVDKKSDGREFERERCAVILGNSLGGEMTDRYAVRLAWPEVARKLVATPPFCDLSEGERLSFLGKMELAYKAGLPVVDEDSMPGELANVIAGRIANAFDLGGANFTVDAACASSMAAIQAAVKSLQSHESDLVLTGGADRSMNVATFVKFCKIGALSPDHSSPFDASANGFVMGEGCGILVLKRYEDAVRDGDRVYAVLRGIGASSDGKGKGITAPNLQGQVRALQRAYAMAGFEPWDVDLVEAHGTSTLVGDKVEVEALNAVIGAGRRTERGPIRLGSVKSMIGHLKSAAGAASVIKTALALHHGVFPPSLNFGTARPDVPFDVIPLRVQTRPEPWPTSRDGLRRAGVSAFGFGGTNFHVVLESYAGQRLRASPPQLPTLAQPIHAASLERVHVAPVADLPPPRVVVEVVSRPALSQRGLPEGVWATSGRNEAELLENLEALAEGRHAPFQPSAPLRVAAAPTDAGERSDQLKRAITGLRKGTNPDLLRARGIAYEDVPFDRKLVFLFTGQGSQYVDMGRDLAAVYPLVQDTFDEADRYLQPALGQRLTDLVNLKPGDDADAKDEVLRRTEYSQPATLTVDVALLRLLVAYGAAPDMVAGHSLGEYGAAVAAGVLTFEQALRAVSARGREMANIRLDDPGKMAGIATGSNVVDEVLADVDGYVIAANKNCPTQTVIAGASDAVDEACERFRARGITVYMLPVSHAFHSAIVAPASEPLRGVLAKLGLRAPRRPITTNVTGGYYPTGPNAVEGIIDLLAQQISAPVEWTAQMERMYEDGGRVFVEVGPKRALSGFTVAILKRRAHRAIYTNHPKRGGVESFRDALAQLLVLGVPLRAKPLATSDVDLFAEAAPRRATTEAITAFGSAPLDVEAPPPAPAAAAADLRDGILRIVARSTGYDVAELDVDFELEADLGIDTVKQAEVFSIVRDTYGIPADPSFSFAEHRTLRRLIDWAAGRTGARRVGVDETTAKPGPAVTAPAPAAPSAHFVGGDVVASFLMQAATAGLNGLDAGAFAKALLPAVQGLLQAAFEAARASAPPAPAQMPVEAEPSPRPPAPLAAAGPPIVIRMAGHPWAFEPARRIVASGASIGLPGGSQVFDDHNFEAILAGQNRISPIGGTRAAQFLDLGLVRLIKDPKTGQGSFLPVTKTEEVIRLAGTERAFDLREWGVDAELVGSLDVTTRLAFAAGLDALRDAGIPLIRTWKTTANGKRVPQGWQLPESLRDGTGVIFGSAFPGYDQLVRHLQAGGRNAEGRFDRRFLFQVLAMGHSQFAQFIGARGPNTALNAACASSTQALAVAEDWIRGGRCERVVVVGADDVTSDALLPWIGGGFMAAGAASTSDTVEEAALPFDRRRHGLVLGMGAVGIVVETPESCAARGVVPLAEQLAAITVNSAFHGTRLDVDHIARIVRGVVADVCAAEGITPEEMASRTMFMSHETYTPARGGSAQAEIDALRAAFGPAARDIVVTNTKGFTGHPMGAGIEDGVVLKALQYGRVPPIANLREPDEALGDLTLSRGEARDFRYALRLAAGFGSQLAVTLHKAVAKGDQRLESHERRLAWLREVTGYPTPEERVEDRTLRVVEGAHEVVHDFSRVRSSDTPSLVVPERLTRATPKPAAASAPVVDALADDQRSLLPTPFASPERVSRPASVLTPAPTSTPASPQDGAAVLAHLVRVVAEKTGYDPGEIEPDFELEADLGIDTVKQAEILSEVMDHHGLTRDEGFRLADHPTLRGLAGWLGERIGASPAAALVEETDPDLVPTPAPVPSRAPDARPAARPAPAPVAPARAAAPEGGGDVASALREIVTLVAEKTGYGEDELEPGFELEADLGIDTVKQAEILSELQERHGIERDESFQLSDYATLEKLAGWLAGRLGGAARPPSLFPLRELVDLSGSDDDISLDRSPEVPWATKPGAPKAAEDDDLLPPAVTAPQAARPAPATPGVPSTDEVLRDLLAVVAEKTGYDLSDLEPGFELEADLGVDTVKQAEILSELQERFHLPPDEGFSPADTRTLDDLARHLHARLMSVSALVDEPTVLAEPPPAGRAAAAQTEDADARPSATDEIALVGRHVALPPGFRLRRPTLRSRGRTPGVSLAGRRVELLGRGAVTERLREELVRRGAQVVDSGADLVLDCADDVAATFARSRALDPGPRPSAWITLTRLGGLGEGDPSVARAFTDGARAGFTKSLGREWGIAWSVLDVHPSHGPTTAAATLCDEAEATPEPEVFWLEDGTRHGVALVEEQPPAPRPVLGVVLMTGGGRGITAAVAQEIARRGPVKLALVGRSPAAEEPLDEKTTREKIRADLTARGERVTPARIEAVLDPLRRAEDVRRNLESLRRAGAQVVYLVADLADPEQARRVVREATERLGTLTHVVHGAGVEESRKLADKDDRAFHRVFDGKAVGGRALLEAVPADAFVVSMGSVAGRFGNPGQVDYAAANDAMARMCHARPRSLHVDWTAWDDVGMAVRGGMRTLLTDRGVDLLPADAGACVLVDLMAAGVSGELVCAGRLGDFEAKPAHPLLDTLEVEGGVARGLRALSKRSDPWIADHAIDGVPVLPGVIGLELMVATAAALFPERRWTGARNVRFNAPVKAYRDEVTTLQLEAEAGRPGEAVARLVSVRSLKTGRTRRTEHFSATLTFDVRAVREGEPAAVDGLPSAFLPDEPIGRDEIYARFFHGPVFQVLEQVLGVSADGLMADGNADDARIAPGLQTFPLVLEAAFQAAGLHRLIVTGSMGLPLEIEELCVLASPGGASMNRVALMVHHDGEVWNVDADGLAGPVLRVRGFRMVEKGPVPPELRFPDPPEGRPNCFPPAGSRRAAVTGTVASAGADADEDPTSWLAPDELDELRARGTERRVRDRIAGRIAAKRALTTLTGVDPLRVRVDTAPSGEPIARVPGAPTARVSISHRDGRAVAVAVLDGRIGVDLERIEARPPSFAVAWLSAAERALCGSAAERETVVWAVKEAVLKWLGTGMRASPHEVEVVSLTPGSATVHLTGPLAELHRDLGGTPLHVAWARHGHDEVVVTVRSAA